MVELDLSWIDYEKLQDYGRKVMDSVREMMSWLAEEAEKHEIDPVLFFLVVNTLTFEMTYAIMQCVAVSEKNTLDIYQEMLRKVLEMQGER